MECRVSLAKAKPARRPVTLDSPAIDKRQFKITEILFLKNEILKKLAPVISQFKNKPNCLTLMRRSFLDRRQKSRNFGLQWLFLSYRLSRIPQKIENKQRHWVLVKFPFCRRKWCVNCYMITRLKIASKLVGPLNFISYFNANFSIKDQKINPNLYVSFIIRKAHEKALESTYYMLFVNRIIRLCYNESHQRNLFSFFFCLDLKA